MHYGFSQCFGHEKAIVEPFEGFFSLLEHV